MVDDPLQAALLDLWQQVPEPRDHVLLGGGYGLYLKQQHLASAGERTLIAAALWPQPRTTQDLDLLLTAELVGDAPSMRAMRPT